MKDLSKKLKKIVDEVNHLLYFNGCFYGVLKVSHFDSVGFAFPELFDDILAQGLLRNTFSVGFGLVGFAVELECYPFAFDNFAVDFKGCL